MPTAKISPTDDGKPTFTSPPRRYIDVKICCHCNASGSHDFHYRDADSSVVYCGPCYRYVRLHPDGDLPPASLLERRRSSPPRAKRVEGKRIWRKVERRQLKASGDTFTCANNHCRAVVRVELARNTDVPDKFICSACQTFARRNEGDVRPERLREHQLRREAGIAYVRPDHQCQSCSVTSAPRWYSIDGIFSPSVSSVHCRHNI